ncbi:MAG: RNA chaperone Hfq [Candidatus Wallbacteria bacterium]|nr:RNA chaperone Hfq [Candidatus Wallbacteria bacterium]
MAKKINLQDNFLNQVRQDGMELTIFLTNGAKIKGILKGFDNFTIVLEVMGKQELVFKHAISTVIAGKRVRNLFQFEDEGGEASSAGETGED